MTERFQTPGHWSSSIVEVELIGCGGTGSAMLDELFRLHSLLVRLDHPGLAVRAWDGDCVSEANIGRQRFWSCDVGWNKSELLINRYNGFGETNWAYVDRMLTADDCGRLRPDLLITCVDSAMTRVMVGDAGRARDRSSTLWLDTGNDQNSGQVILGHWSGYSNDKAAGEITLPNILDLYPSLRDQDAARRPSCSTEEAVQRQAFGINQRVAVEASGLLWQLLRHGELRRHGSYVYQDAGETLPMPIDPAAWASFGVDLPPVVDS